MSGDLQFDTSVFPQELGTAKVVPNNGRFVTDATVCPQDIANPTDLTLLTMPGKNLKN